MGRKMFHVEQFERQWKMWEAIRGPGFALRDRD